MSNITLLRITDERPKMTAVTSMAPAKAANKTAMKPVKVTPPAVRLPPMANMTRATPRPAPLLIPKTSGPASGFRKAVWSMSPLTAMAPPPNRAVRAWGRRDSRMMNRHDGLPPEWPVSTRTTSSTGMRTLPTSRLSMKSSPMTAPIATPYRSPLLRT